MVLDDGGLGVLSKLDGLLDGSVHMGWKKLADQQAGDLAIDTLLEDNLPPEEIFALFAPDAAEELARFRPRLRPANPPPRWNSGLSPNVTAS